MSGVLLGCEDSEGPFDDLDLHRCLRDHFPIRIDRLWAFGPDLKMIGMIHPNIIPIAMLSALEGRKHDGELPQCL